MAEILKEWLTERLKRPISWEAEEFGDMMKNGYVIADVLNSYNVINDEKHFLIKSSFKHEDIKSNWKYLSEWLADIDVFINAPDLENIMDGKGSAILRLFYQMFLHLDKRDRTNFIKRERKMVSGLIEKLGHRFKVDNVPEEKLSFVDNLSKPLLNEKHFIEWQRKKAEQVKDTYDYVRHKYSKMIKNIKEAKTPMQFKTTLPPKLTRTERKEMEKFALKYPCKFQNYTYEQLLALEQNASDQKSSISGSDWAKNYMDNLHTRMRKKTDSEEFQKQLRNGLSSSQWDASIAEEESKLDTELAKKVLKLSQFEKKMCTQLMETKQQARNLVQNRVQAEKEFAEQRELQFNQFLDNIKEDIQLEHAEIDFEKQRQIMLHKKLYAEKMRRKRLHYYEICYDTMLSIVDYATKYAYYKKLIGDDIPDHFLHEWKLLYYKQQAIFDILEPMEDILKDSIEEDTTPIVEEIIRLELDRQEALNDSEFKLYHDYSYPWTLDLLIPNYDPESEERKYEYLGTRVIGHMVYTLLEMKYPYPPQLPPAKLPPYEVKALLRCLPDRSITVPMQTLLNLRRIHVVRIEKAINFCLRKFKSEMVGCTDIDLSFDKFIAAAPEEEQKELIKLMKSEDEVIRQSELAIAAMIGALPANTKQTQTPKTIPEEEMKLSDPGELGRYVYESLSIGDSLTDHLLSAIIVEYLKDQYNIAGFVIINYPNSYREAQILEETFSGFTPPDEGDLEDRDDIYLEECIQKHRKKEKDPHKEVRESKLVSDPHKKKIPKQFESYFTCYIHLKETEDILQELVIWDLTEDNSELIDRFYAVLGLNYSMYYELIDKEFLAQICKYIIGDFIMPLKSIDQLFGEKVLSELDFPSSLDKRIKSKIVKPEVLSGKSKSKVHSGSKTSKTTEDERKEPSVEEFPDDGVLIMEDLDAEEILSQSVTVEEIKLLAGEEDWDYGEIPISQIIGVALATCWEEIEKVYINDMQQLFFAKRLQMNCLIPYARFIKDKMEQIITLPSYKQDLVCSFQKEYNDFESDWRDINFSKNEWHCRIKELQNKLCKICDERKKHAEQQRLALICDNWAMEELTTMVNTYISCMQTELNRSMLTFQSLYDFYYAMIKHLPALDRIQFKELTKIYRESDDTSTSGSKKGSEEKAFRQLRSAFQELQLKNIEIDFNNNPFNLMIENNVKFALKVIKDTNDQFRSLIAKDYTEIAKIQPVIKKKEDVLEETVNAEEVFKENAMKCIEEWTMGINGEMFRASLRMQALQYKCYRDMKLFNDQIYKAFTEIQNDINTYYINEIKSVDRLCKYLQMAVEHGRRIPETLVLEHDTFIIDPNLLQFTQEPPADIEPTSEVVDRMDFKISQLASLRTQFKTVSPTGIILQQAFIYLLQDFLFFGKETCDGPLFPEAWTSLDPEQIPKLVFMLFGETVYVDWRDFLIYCLNINFPDVDELLELRHRLRCNDPSSTELINRDDFVTEELWFEKDIDPDDNRARLRNNMMKHFLFELFETEENMMNYSAFLLAFCKNINPIKGFVTALSMAIGKKTCFDPDECEDVVRKLVKYKQYRDECLACANKCTKEFIDTLIEKVVNICETTTVIELEYVASDVMKDGKKRKGSKYPKKLESSQSARTPKMQKSAGSKNKMVQSATNVKTTFICPPCEVAVEEEKPMKQEVEEEIEEEAEEDLELAYVVSQSVIWNVLRICLPWHFVMIPEERKTPYEEQVTEVLKRLEVDTENGDIYVCRFVTDPQICTLLHKVKKFTALYLADEVHKVFV